MTRAKRTMPVTHAERTMPDALRPAAGHGPLPAYPHLPPEWRRLAGRIVASPCTRPDDLLTLADALDEAARELMAPTDDDSLRTPPAQHDARALAAELRRRAPERARP